MNIDSKRLAKADLHIHTTASDGKMTPAEVVRTAAALKLAVISITDHDTIGGVRPAQEAAQALALEVIPGVEITTAFIDRECHLLAYAFDVENTELNQLLSRQRTARVERTKWIIGELQKKGLALDIDEVRAEAKSRNLGRPHIAAVLRDKGYVGTFKEAFIRYLSDEKLGTIKNNYESLDRVIEIVKQAGGVTILAHPGRLYNQEELKRFAEAGIDGLEVIHPSHYYKLQKKMADFAQDRHLLQSGGSDFHGKEKGYYAHLGVVTIRTGWVKKIQRLAERRNKISV